MMKPARCGALMAWALAPLVVLGAPSAQQDYLDAVRTKPDLQNGAALFGTCAACHGANGGGSADDNVPRIAGQFRQVVIRQLVDYRYDKRVDPQMQRIADRHQQLTARQMGDVAAFAASLQAGPPAVSGRADYLQPGAQAYARRCASCHGAAGEGDGAAVVPRLAGQHSRYLLRQFNDALDGRRPQLARSHGDYLQDLDREVLQGMADALSRMGVAVAPGEGNARR